MELKKNLSRYQDKLGPLDQALESRQVPECSQPQVSDVCESPNNHNHLKEASSNSSALDVKSDQPHHITERSLNKGISVLGTHPVDPSDETVSLDLPRQDIPKLVQDGETVADLTNSQGSSSNMVIKTETVQPVSLIQASERSTVTLSKGLTLNIPASISALQPVETPDNFESPERNGIDPTGCLSPNSYSVFKDFLNHNPDMNLPWQPLRSASQCSCGVAFSYSCKKVSTFINGVGTLNGLGVKMIVAVMQPYNPQKFSLPTKKYIFQIFGGWAP